MEDLNDTKTTKGRKAQKRGKGAGTLVRHGRVWQARWRVDGRLFTRSTGTSNKREALELLAEYVKPYRAKTERERLNAIGAQIEGKDAEIRKYVDDLPALPLMAGFSAYTKTEDGKRPTKETAYMYECQYFRFVDWVKQHHPEIKELRAVTKKTAREFDEYLSQHFTPNTRKKYLSLLAKIWKAIGAQEADEQEDADAIPSKDAAAQMARLDGNPWERIRDLVKTSPADSTRRRALTIEEIGRIIETLEGEMRLLFIIGCYTGARLEDCALLEWGQVDLLLGTITLSPRKTRRKNPEPKIIPIHRTLLGELFQIPEKKRRGYILPDLAARYKRDNGNLSASIQDIFTKNGIETTIKPEEGKRAKTIVGFHSLRHFAATMITETGRLEQAQYMLGHTSPDMTLHYNHPRLVALRQTIDAIPALGCADTPEAHTDATCAILEALYAQVDSLPKDAQRSLIQHLKANLK